jgi:cellulose biosynthesis protein BcsQ
LHSISIFNNKGGVGKTTLTFHLAHALAEMGHKTLIMDLDPQCNLTILGMEEERLHEIWKTEDPFIDDFPNARNSYSTNDFNEILKKTRSIHFSLKPTQDGAAELPSLPPPFALATNLDLLPGRLSMHLYEDKIASRWSEVYQGDPLALRTLTRPRALAEEYAQAHNYKFVIMDTSPSLGVLNKAIISTTDGFLIPCAPDMFSLYGVKNIGNALSIWKKQFDTILHLLSEEKRKQFPSHFVEFLGFTIYNARKYEGNNDWSLATAHMNHALKIPETVKKHISKELRTRVPDTDLSVPVGGTSVMHSHSTLPNMAQKYHVPIWKVPSHSPLDASDKQTVSGNRARYEATRDGYRSFATDLLKRIGALP